jgi:twitching motility protein PilT
VEELARLLTYLDHEGVTELVLGSNQPVTVRRGGSYIAVTTEPLSHAQLARMLLGSPFDPLLPEGEGIGEMTEVDTGTRMVKAQIARRGSEILIRVEPMRRRGASAARKPAVEERRQKRASQSGPVAAPLPPPPVAAPAPMPTMPPPIAHPPTAHPPIAHPSATHPPPIPMSRTATIERSRLSVDDDPRNAEAPPQIAAKAHAPVDVSPMRTHPVRPTPRPSSSPHVIAGPPPVAAMSAYDDSLAIGASDLAIGEAIEALPLDPRDNPRDNPHAAPSPVKKSAPGVDLAPPNPYMVDAPSVLDLSPSAAARTRTTMAPLPPRAPAQTTQAQQAVPTIAIQQSPSGTFEAIGEEDFELPPPVRAPASRTAAPPPAAVPPAPPTPVAPPPLPVSVTLPPPLPVVTPALAAAPLPPVAHEGVPPATVQLVDERANVEPMLAIVRGCRDRGVTDVHIASNRPVMIRAVGELFPLDPTIVTPQMADALLLPLLGPQGRSQLHVRGYVDLAIDVPGAGRLRGNVSRQKEGLKGSFRLARITPPTLDELGLPKELAKVIAHHQGLVVISGPSGHGKTTTLNALVDMLNSSRAHHILMIEDPVEIEHPRKRAVVSQREVNRHTTSFAAALKASLREDPDVIVIGELRDRESVEIALTAAETGHLVMTTMSTPSAAKTIDRLIDMFPSEDQPQVRASLGGALRAIVAQRLLPRVDGRGLVAAVELLTGVLPLIALIRDNKLYQLPSLMQRGRAFGMIRLDDSLVELIRNGVVAEDVALRASDNRRELAALLRPQERPTTLSPPTNTPAKKGGLFRRDKE